MSSNNLQIGPVWRIAPSGTTQVYLSKVHGDGTASVHSAGQKSRWAIKPMKVAVIDLFADRTVAREEYRRRLVAVRDYPTARPNVVTQLA